MKPHGILTATLAIAFFTIGNIFAQNPIITDMFTADPAPLVYNDTVFLYTGHDTASVHAPNYRMEDWYVFSTTDMVHWKNHGSCLSPGTFSWADKDAYAAQCIQRNGKFFWYVSTFHKSDENSKGGAAIGVAVSDRPTGPFKDAIGKALITNEMTTDMKHSWDDIDPTVFVDDDGQAYLFWGNGSCKWAKLKENMIELDGPITAFKPEHFIEGPWVYKRNGLYYLVYAGAGTKPEMIEYCTATSPTGPWTYKGIIQDNVQNSFTTHPGIADYKGSTYFFYHNGALPTGSMYRRSVCVDYMYYNPDGTIRKVIQTTQGVNCISSKAQVSQAQNPVIFADVPDMSIVRVGDTYYMSSTTMHMSPGVPIMRSKDLVNWQIVNYAYDVLDTADVLTLRNGKNMYGRGSWASCIRYHNNTFYVTTFAQTTGKTYIFSTKDIENGPWKTTSFQPVYHDNTLFFDDDGRIYLIYGNGKLSLVELKEDLSGVKPETDRVLIENASLPAGTNIMLGAEGSQLFKVNGNYYIFNITWPRGGMRTVVVHRADKITGPYEGRLAFQDLGVAQGGIIDTPNGNWYAYLFRDFGAVGRIPYLIPVKWEDGWPVLGVDGKAPEKLNLPASNGLIPGIVASDEFSRRNGEPALPLIWQWNHNPDNSLWSVTQRKGYLRLTTGRTDTSFVQARNTLTQRTIGPECSGSTSMDVSHMKDGDFAGLALLQRKFGLVGISMENGIKSLVMVSAESGRPVEIKRVAFSQDKVFLKAECDFNNRKDTGYFYFSLDGKTWTAIGSELKMEYSMPHFMGYRFGLFNYATKTTGGFVDFDYFHITNQMSQSN
jgi:beta-xylosidase